MKYLDPRFWFYVFKGADSARNILCRIKGHPKGCVWFNTTGLEPDYSCKDCGEYLG